MISLHQFFDGYRRSKEGVVEYGRRYFSDWRGRWTDSHLSGNGKEKPVRTIEIIMSAATLPIVPVELFSIVYEWNIVPLPVRMAGVVHSVHTAGFLTISVRKPG